MKDYNRHKIIKMSYIILLSVILITGCGKENSERVTEVELEESSQLPEDRTETREKQTDKTEASEEKTPDGGSVFVYVCGAVQAPGVYELSSEARVYEAIASAGGIREDAAGEALNQASVVKDGERIYIPTKEELERGIADGLAPEVTGEDSNNEGKININTAQKDELKTLPGIGDAKADSILSYREANGAFQRTEDLMQVEGIKEGVYNKIKDQITV